MRGFSLWVGFIFLLSGCATYRVSLPPPPVEKVYHVVREGDTLWKIARMYEVDLRELIRLNNIQDPNSLEVGEVLLIPPSRETQKESVRQSISFTPGKEGGFIWPAKGEVVEYFGKGKGRDPRGIDLTLEENSPVRASRSGEVIYVGELRGYGKVIMINHGDGYITVYAGNLRLKVNEGDRVRQGEVIAHGEGKLHFEIREKDEARNPLTYLD